jgi:hypothetical protein
MSSKQNTLKNEMIDIGWPARAGAVVFDTSQNIQSIVEILWLRNGLKALTKVLTQSKSSRFGVGLPNPKRVIDLFKKYQLDSNPMNNRRIWIIV